MAGPLVVDHAVTVENLPAWLDIARLLGPGAWTCSAAQDDRLTARAQVDRATAADLVVRLRHAPVAGRYLIIETRPAIPRTALRHARTLDLQRRRRTTPGFSRAETRCDAEGRHSLTPETLALQMGHMARGRTVVDAGCGVGGNTIGFARAGCRVIAIERNARRIALARHNATVYGVTDQITFVQGDAAAHLSTLRADVLFVDPPWGVDWTTRQPTLADLPLLSACLAQRERFDAIWAKVPPSFDPDVLPADERSVQALFGASAGDERYIKFLLVKLRERRRDG